MTIWLIGSQAAKIHGLNFLRKTNEEEYDVIGGKLDFAHWSEIALSFGENVKIKESKNFPGKYKITGKFAGKDVVVEFDATENPSNLLIDDYYEPDGNTNIFGFDNITVAPKHLLYEIKRAHANFDVHFEKTLLDVIAMKEAGWDNAATLSHFYAERHAEAKERFGKRQDRIKLNKSNEDFFKAGMSLRKFVHDDLHKAVAYFPDYPMFVRCKRDPNSAKIERDLFELLNDDFKIKMAQEESCVLFLERDYIPQHFDEGTPLSEDEILPMYRKAVIKVMRDLCKGWFQSFMIDNAKEIMKMPPWNPVEDFWAAHEAGKLAEIK